MQKFDPYINVDFNKRATEEAVIPFPNPDTTPPVTNTYFVITYLLKQQKI